MSHLGFNSHLWIDQEPAILKQFFSGLPIQSNGAVETIRHFATHGFCVLRQAIPAQLIDRYLGILRSPALGFPLKASMGRDVFPLDHLDPNQPIVKILDTHYAFSEARDICLAPVITDLLEIIFQEKPLAFQSLFFQVGSTQAVHQDGAYVVVDPPSHFLAAWIALEDVQEGSGELVYYPGSHRFPQYLYGKEGARRKHWDPAIDGHAVHDQHLEWIHRTAAERGIALQKFRPRKGDVLLWHSDLAHGGAPILDASLSRRSLVTHYCPVSARPLYMRGLMAAQIRHRVGRHGSQAFHSSGYYSRADLRQAPVRGAFRALAALGGRGMVTPQGTGRSSLASPTPAADPLLPLLERIIAVRSAGNPRESLRLISSARSGGESSPWLDDNEARALVDLGRRDEAVAIWERLQSDPDPHLAAAASRMLILQRQP
jgi:phytanoyl-CoA hydroxylase